ncbi:MAG: archaeal proteasome endopeptidase complex subunit alpha [Nanoarchaeota archaeon]
MDIPAEMQNQVMGYDRAATMFSPDGHLLQVEYAEKTVRLGSASIGLICVDGVALVADRRIIDELIKQESAVKIFEIDNHIAATAAGILSDARILVERAQLVGQQNRVTYDTGIDVESVIKDISNLKQNFTQYGGVRPFGVSMLIAGISGGKPKLFVSDITGNYFSYYATAIGENDERIKEILRKEYKDSMNMEEGIKMSFKIFKEILGKNFNINRFDAAYIPTKEAQLKRLSGESLKKYIKI